MTGRQKLARALLILAAAVAVYLVAAQHRYTYIRMSDATFVQVDRWLGDHRSCLVRSTLLDCGTWDW